MSEVLHIMMFRLGWVCRTHYEQVCANYARRTRQYMELELYLEDLAKTTPHDHIKKEIADVLRKANRIT